MHECVFGFGDSALRISFICATHVGMETRINRLLPVCEAPYRHLGGTPQKANTVGMVSLLSLQNNSAQASPTSAEAPSPPHVWSIRSCVCAPTSTLRSPFAFVILLLQRQLRPNYLPNIFLVPVLLLLQSLSWILYTAEAYASTDMYTAITATPLVLVVGGGTEIRLCSGQSDNNSHCMIVEKLHIRCSCFGVYPFILAKCYVSVHAVYIYVYIILYVSIIYIIIVY
jgi:hypothetical protein